MGWWWEKKEFRWCGCQNRRKKRKFSEKKTWRISILELLNFIYPWSTYTTQPISKLTLVLLVSWNSDKKRRKEREMMDDGKRKKNFSDVIVEIRGKKIQWEKNMKNFGIRITEIHLPLAYKYCPTLVSFLKKIIKLDAIRSRTHKARLFPLEVNQCTTTLHLTLIGKLNLFILKIIGISSKKEKAYIFFSILSKIL